RGLRRRGPLLADHAPGPRRPRGRDRVRSAAVRRDPRVGERGGLLRDRPRGDAHGVGRLARLGHRRARGVPPLQRDWMADVQLGDARLHRRRRRLRLHPPSREHRADHQGRRAESRDFLTVAVLGAGAWGTTLATILARDGGRAVVLWTRDPAQAEEMSAHRENRKYLAGIRIPDNVDVTAELRRALASDDLIVAVPSQGVRALRDRLGPLRAEQRLLSATKGLADDGRRMSQLWAETLAPD